MSNIFRFMWQNTILINLTICLIQTNYLTASTQKIEEPINEILIPSIENISSDSDFENDSLKSSINNEVENSEETDEELEKVTKHRVAYLNLITSDQVYDAGVHFQKKIFSSNQYKQNWKNEIVLDFGDIAYIFPEVILHYIVDVKCLGFSWIPPVDFIHNLKFGTFKETKKSEEKIIRKIGYLLLSDGVILDSHGGDFNLQADKYRKAQDKICSKASTCNEKIVHDRMVETIKKIIDLTLSKPSEEYDTDKAIEGIGIIEVNLDQL